jgi:hypothetical protein
MPSYEVVEATQAKTLPAKDDKPELAVDHYTLRSNGQQILVTCFRRATTPIPTAGQTLEGELGDQDNFEKGRRKFKRSRPGGGTMRRRDPGESRRIEMQSARRDALHYIELKVKLGKVEDFDISDVGKVADGLQRLLEPPPAPSDVPGDTTGLPPANDL